MDISRLQIDQSKMLASGAEYFKLFEKHLPTGLNASDTVLIYEISNLSCIKKIIGLNPEAKHIVVGSNACNRALKMVLPKAINVEYLEELDLKETDMKFDCIIMNPPYQKNLHLKILAEAIKHLKDEKSVCVNLSPVGKLQYAWRRGKIAKELSFLSTSNVDIELLECDKAVALFMLGNIGADLGIWTCRNNGHTNVFDLGKALTPHAGFIEHMKNALTNIPVMKSKMIDAEAVKDKKSLFVKFVTGLSLKNNGGHGASSYAATSVNFSTATRFTPGHHCCYVLFNNKDEQLFFWKIYTSTLMRFIYMTVMGAGTEYDLLPWLGDAINPRTGKKGYTGEWTDDDLYKFFNITSEEQKIIEDTMKKYK